MSLKPCIAPRCGELSEESRCPEHRIKYRPKSTKRSRNNPTRWKALSRRLRRLQPWCTQCNATEHLTVDHIVPVSVDPDREFDESNLQVLCKSCNSQKGTKSTTPEPPPVTIARRAGEPQSPTLSPEDGV